MAELSLRLVIVMVGLPATGKSFIVKKLARYLNWLQYPTRVFNVGEVRRKAASINNEDALPGLHSTSVSSFFDPSNTNNVSRRDQMALHALDELLQWIIRDDNRVGILDATNSTRERRKLVLQYIRDVAGFELPVLFLESICSDKAVLDRNFALKLSGPDYQTQDPEKALDDFKKRVALYREAYVPICLDEEAENMSYVKLIDVGRKMSTHMIRGVLSTQVVEYMLGFNLTDRQLWISCGGESEDDIAGRIGRCSNLSHAGRTYAEDLAKFVQTKNDAWDKDTAPMSRKEFIIWTSTMPQTTQTADAFQSQHYRKVKHKTLDDINAGDMAGATFEHIRTEFPNIHMARKTHKLLYRWPGLGGESYADVIRRLRTVIVELERSTEHVLVLSHRGVIRVLLSYFLDLQREDLPEMPIPKDTVFLLEPQPYGINFYAFSYDGCNRSFTEIPHAKEQFKAN